MNAMILTLSLVVLSVTVAGKQEDYMAFCDEIRRDWNYIYFAVCIYIFTLPIYTKMLELQDTLTFAWCVNEDSFVCYEITFQYAAEFWCFLFHLTKPLPHN